MTSIRAPAEAAGERIDRYLARALSRPRNRIRHLLLGGHVRINGAAPKPSHVLRGGEEIQMLLPTPPPDRLPLAEEGRLPVLYADEDLLVIDKPAGLVVHPGAGVPGGTLVNRLLHHHPEIAAVGSPQRPGIVHRLDIGTSGALAVARTDAAYTALSRAFAERRVEKLYLAVVHGRPKEASGTIDRPIGRHPTQRTRMAVVDAARGGRSALTRYRVMATSTGLSLLELMLITGRTHQIRVHCKAIGHPLVGDPSYGEARWQNLPPNLESTVRDFPRPALHARRLTLPPLLGEPARSFVSAIPEDLRKLCAECELDQESWAAETTRGEFRPASGLAALTDAP